jgi:hydrogenase expression/formation protein HypD
MRVPSSLGSLEQARARGCEIQVVYSARDALDLARSRPERTVAFLAVGFETTAPTILAALAEAEREGVRNFVLLPGNKIVPPPLRALAADPGVRLGGVLLPGHVSVVTGWKAFRFLATEHGLPAVVVGFTPADVLRGVLELVRRAASGTPEVVNLYGRVVTADGNPHALALLERFFEPVTTTWRGLGPIPDSGLAFRGMWAHRDASRIEVDVPEPREPEGCRCGEVLKGRVEPPECPLFASACTPETPVGACMVSSEGTCAAWYRHERWQGAAAP